MKILLATRLKKRRKELGWSQKKLADGVCDQGQISRIEKGAYMPGADLLHALAKKLQVRMDYFFDEEESEIVSDLKQFRKLVKNCLLQKDYEALAFLYEKEKETLSHLTFPDQVYIEWVDAILAENLNDSREESIQKHRELLERVGEDWKGYIYLYNSLLSLLIRDKKYSEVEALYSEIDEKINKQDLELLIDMESYFSIQSNYTRFLWLTDQRDKGIELVTECIDDFKSIYPIHFLADYYCDLGNFTEEFADKTLVKERFELSRVLFELAGVDTIALKIEKYIKEQYSE
ncbi:helix-turn-helix domain-containing protein [Streptococcus suis]|uniref:Helix-turn-helix domain-containing protein n=1 Tax=Streptococcus suis TaxID=1307 RepID=A0A6L8MWI0_STRSU|nr:helix-turn-helix domain-containing protein [Streptococcus suis]